MKLNLLPILVFALTLAWTAYPSFADTTGKTDTFFYKDSGTAITITGTVDKAARTLEIPSEINGKPVTAIEARGTDCRVFTRCVALAAINVDPANQSFSSVDGVLFDKTQTTLIQFPPGKAGAFTIPAEVGAIWNSAFDGSAGLVAIHADTANPTYSSVDGVLFNKSQDKLLRYPCGKPGEYKIPSSVVSVHTGAFRGCQGLTSVTVSAGVRSLGCFQQGFPECSALTSINVEEGNPRLSSVDGVLYDKSGSTLIQCPAGKSGSVVIPTSVTRIWTIAFSGCKALTEVTLPPGVETIEKATFQQCTGLKTMTIPSSVTKIEMGAFNGCSGLTSLTISEGVAAIGSYAFARCSGLVEIVFPASVTAIGDQAFFECSSLGNVKFLGNPPTMGKGVFDRTAMGTTPAGS